MQKSDQIIHIIISISPSCLFIIYDNSSLLEAKQNETKTITLGLSLRIEIFNNKIFQDFISLEISSKITCYITSSNTNWNTIVLIIFYIFTGQEPVSFYYLKKFCSPSKKKKLYITKFVMPKNYSPLPQINHLEYNLQCHHKDASHLKRIKYNYPSTCSVKHL